MNHFGLDVLVLVVDLVEISAMSAVGRTMVNIQPRRNWIFATFSLEPKTEITGNESIDCWSTEELIQLSFEGSTNFFRPQESYADFTVKLRKNSFLMTLSAKNDNVIKKQNTLSHTMNTRGLWAPWRYRSPCRYRHQQIPWEALSQFVWRGIVAICMEHLTLFSRSCRRTNK